MRPPPSTARKLRLRVESLRALTLAPEQLVRAAGGTGKTDGRNETCYECSGSLALGSVKF